MSAHSGQAEAVQLQRLHITPFRPDLLSAYLGPTLLPLAKDVSYHVVQNFPEVGFGYLELPMSEATKLKKKLNGSILKGHKVRIEDAQPEKRKRESADDDDIEEAEVPSKKTRRSKKPKSGDKVLQGVELEDGRKVKRGWTETPAEKRQEKELRKKEKSSSKDNPEKEAKKEKKKAAKREASKYTNEPECLFRTGLPAEAAEANDKKSKKDKRTKGEKVVHEFENTKKHASFLKSGLISTQSATKEYIDGKGWVDAEGNVLEAESLAQKEKRERKARRKEQKVAAANLAATNGEGTSKPVVKKKKRPPKEPSPIESEASSTDLSSPEPSSDEGSSASEDEEDSAVKIIDENDKQEEIAEPKPIHPLEALYKRPVLSPLETTPKTPKASSFSFFGGSNDSDIEQEAAEQPTEPQTPYTEQDMEWRGIRSAAPTPDTAAIGKRFSFSVMDDIDEDEDGEEAQHGDAANGMASAVHGLGIVQGTDLSPSKTKLAQGSGEEREESEFAKWFYDNRSENNKKWRARRREAMKMKRKRENRRLTRRIV